jgi:hypothetical protein
MYDTLSRVSLAWCRDASVRTPCSRECIMNYMTFKLMRTILAENPPGREAAAAWPCHLASCQRWTQPAGCHILYGILGHMLSGNPVSNSTLCTASRPITIKAASAVDARSRSQRSRSDRGATHCNGCVRPMLDKS